MFTQRLFGILLLAAISSGAAAESGADELFIRRLEPLMGQKCLACHGKDPAKIKSGYDMRTRDAFFKGGESGSAAVTPGKPDDSPLFLAITRTHADWEPMPPKENDRLTAEQIEWFKQWIAGGAPWPDDARRKEIAGNADKWAAEDGIAVRTSGGLAPEWTNRRYKPENLWAYQPLRKPAVPETGAANAIDSFLDAKLPAAADRRTLIRRATFDLLGLPPTPEEIAAFVDDLDPDERAFAKVVERLLTSPHYGEQWGRHWLDVVRYADSGGFSNDYARGNAWRYRDYVVRAFNGDKPYDRFIREQIAGDELAATQHSTLNIQPSAELIATGFLRMGPWELTGMEVPKVARQRFLDDVTDSVGQVFLAHPLQCARCHDHKFDPIPTRDYYSFQAVFATTQFAERPAPFLPEENTAGFEEKKYLAQREQYFAGVLQRLDAKSLAAARAWYVEKKIDPAVFEQTVVEVMGRKGKRGREAGYGEVRAVLMKRGIPESQVPPKQAGFVPEDFGIDRIARKGTERIAWELDRYEPLAFSVYDGCTPDTKTVFSPMRMPADPMNGGEVEDTCILTGGDPLGSGAKVRPAVLSAATLLGGMAEAPIELPAAIEGRRLALAEWIASPRNPLTARVMVNRIWLWHFGEALAGNPNNFGATGKKPTNPELLDWLAATFIERGWSVKEMHRAIMSSAAYRRADFQPRRLSAEELRDTMLSATGELNPALGGIPVRPEMNREAAHQPRQVMGTFAEAWQPSPRPAERHRRSLYALHIRGQRDPFMEVFNEPGPDLSCERRDASTVTPQVFSLFNSEASYDRALAFAARLLREAEGGEAAVQRAFALAFGRAPKPEEIRSCLAHWEAMTARHRALHFEKRASPREVVREAVEENTGEKFKFTEPLEAAADFIPDLQPADASPELRGLAEVCLVLLNSSEFAYVY